MKHTWAHTNNFRFHNPIIMMSTKEFFLRWWCEHYGKTHIFSLTLNHSTDRINNTSVLFCFRNLLFRSINSQLSCIIVIIACRFFSLSYFSTDYHLQFFAHWCKYQYEYVFLTSFLLVDWMRVKNRITRI